MRRAGCLLLALSLPLLPVAAGPGTNLGQLNILVDFLNYTAFTPQDMETLPSTLGESITSSLGLRDDAISNAAGRVGVVDLNPGTMRNEWMPSQWPLVKPGKATLVHGQLHLPTPSMAFIAESTLGGSLFESEIRKRVEDALGAHSDAITGQISVGAASVYEATVTTPAPLQNSLPGKGQQLLWYIGLGMLVLVAVGIILCCVRSLCMSMSTPKNVTGYDSGFLQVNSYDDDVPIYEDPMKLFRGQGH
mmetsp:Transcript_44345/g.103634  ORF Transcript_44345/g.103634 Transcript_44345/m.103634 type:complete len:248 (+) Transcript_44345:55-798(+)